MKNEEATEIQRPLTPMEIMAEVLKNKNPLEAVEVVKELAKLQMEMQRHEADMQLRKAEIEFNGALQEAQTEAKLVINDSEKAGPWGKRWATYRALNREVRPICKKYGLGISYGSQVSPVPDQMVVIAHVSKGLYTRDYSVPMDISGKGPKGDGALAKPHAISAGLEYARRDLIRMIFDLITGEEADDPLVTNGELIKELDKIHNAPTLEDMKDTYSSLYEKYEATPDILKAVIAARKERIKRGF